MLVNVPAPRTGWHPATIVAVISGVLAVVLSGISLIGIFLVLWALLATIAAVICGFVDHKVARSLLAGWALFAFVFYAFWALIVGLLWSILGIGLILVAGSLFGFVAAVACLVELIGSIRGSQNAPMHAATPFYGLPPIVINNNANAQMGHHQFAGTIAKNAGQADRAFGGTMRIGVIDSGRPLPDIQVSARDVLVVGRDATADIRISDSRASRRHLEIRIEGSTWIVRDLGAMNPARVISSRGEERQLQGGTTRLEHGQIAVGESIITLYPLNGRN